MIDTSKIINNGAFIAKVAKWAEERDLALVLSETEYKWRVEAENKRHATTLAQLEQAKQVSRERAFVLFETRQDGAMNFATHLLEQGKPLPEHWKF
jgi:hypothetical protein